VFGIAYIASRSPVNTVLNVPLQVPTIHAGRTGMGYFLLSSGDKFTAVVFNFHRQAIQNAFLSVLVLRVLASTGARMRMIGGHKPCHIMAK